MMKPLIRFTIGPVQDDGYKCLKLSIQSIKMLYDSDIVICYNCDEQMIKKELAEFDDITFFDQRPLEKIKGTPDAKGVSWKLYPPRLDINRHEILIDNDIILRERIPQIDRFLEGDVTLLAEGDHRSYGKFDRHVPKGFHINSGIYGMPPGFDFEKYIKFYSGTQWEKNVSADNEKSWTFDEQGLVALSLLDYPAYEIIPKTTVTLCEKKLIWGKGLHFISLNRKKKHQPFCEYLLSKIKIHL